MSQQNKIIIALVALVIIGLAAYSVSHKNTDDVVMADGAQTPDTSGASDTSDASSAAAPSEAGETAGLATAIQAAMDSNAGALETPNPLGEIMLGAPDAPITIVEYSSLTCPHCGAFHRDTLPKLKEQYIDTGDVKILFRPFPFDPYATAGAMLAHCVAPKARVGFLDVLFKRQQQWIQSEAPMQALQSLSRQAGLSEADFVICLKDENLLNGIRYMQKAAADELGVRSTPTFFINGEMVQGNQPLAEFDKRIKPLLN